MVISKIIVPSLSLTGEIQQKSWNRTCRKAVAIFALSPFESLARRKSWMAAVLWEPFSLRMVGELRTTEQGKVAFLYTPRNIPCWHWETLGTGPPTSKLLLWIWRKVYSLSANAALVRNECNWTQLLCRNLSLECKPFFYSAEPIPVCPHWLGPHSISYKSYSVPCCALGESWTTQSTGHPLWLCKRLSACQLLATCLHGPNSFIVSDPHRRSTHER